MMPVNVTAIGAGGERGLAQGSYAAAAAAAAKMVLLTVALLPAASE